MKDNKNPTERLAALDLLRFLAAASVVLYHLTYRPRIDGIVTTTMFGAVQAVTKFGYLGVELFFLVSGFVILWSASGRRAPAFVISRISRLYPSYWCGIFTTTGLLLWLRPERVHANLPTLLGNLTMLPGRFGVPAVDGVYWTLAVEAKFYAIVLLLILFDQMRRIEIWLYVWIVLFTLGSLFPGSHLGSLTLYPFGSYFCGGCLAFVIWKDGPNAWRLGAFLCAAALSVAGGANEQLDFVTNPSNADQLGAAAIIALEFALILAIALRRIRFEHGGFAVALGAITYPLYLVHHEVGKAMFLKLLPVTGEWFALAATLVSVFAISWAMVLAVERKACPYLRTTLTNAWLRVKGAV